MTTARMFSMSRSAGVARACRYGLMGDTRLYHHVRHARLAAVIRGCRRAPLAVRQHARVLVVGEVLWDLLPGGAQLGGAPLNVAAHLARLGHAARLVSAVGTDTLGDEARSAITALGHRHGPPAVDSALPDRHREGRVSPSDETTFSHLGPRPTTPSICRAMFESLAEWNAEWICHGTLFPSCSAARAVLQRVIAAHQARYASTT